MNCIFCKIVKKEIESEILFENDNFLVIKDINPKAKIHLLVVSKKHIENANQLNENDNQFISNLILTATRIAKDMGFSEKGYKLLMNVGKGGGQLINHIHLHILSDNQESKKMKEII
jgi:histidine triad (HIT) family protein